MKVQVTEAITIGYGGKYHHTGATFEIDPAHLPQISHLVAVLDVLEEEEQEPTPASETATEGTAEPQEGQLEKDPSELTVTELKEELDRRGIEYPKKALKDDLIHLIK